MPEQQAKVHSQLTAFWCFVCLFLASFVMVVMAILAFAFIVNSSGKYAPLPPLFLAVLIAYLLAIFWFIPWYEKGWQNHKPVMKNRVVLYDSDAVKADKNSLLKSDEYLIERLPQQPDISTKAQNTSVRISWDESFTYAKDFAGMVLGEIEKSGLPPDIYTYIAINLIVAGGCERLASFFDFNENEYKRLLEKAMAEITINYDVDITKLNNELRDRINSQSLTSDNRKLVVFGIKAMNKMLRQTGIEPCKGLGKVFLAWRDEIAKELLPLDVIADHKMPLTMMFTDIVDSTMMAEVNGEQFAYEIMHVHNDVVAKAIKNFKGRQIKLMGDGAFACFSNPKDAVNAAIQMQREWAKFNRDNPDKVFFVRIGLNLGNPIIENGDLFGLCVGRTSRVCHVAQGATIFVTHDLYNDLIDAGFELKDEGLFTFKGIVEKERVYSINWLPSVNKVRKTAA